MISSYFPNALRAYRLSPPVERELLNTFRGEDRAVPVTFPKYVELMIARRLSEQTRILDEDHAEQQETWKHLKKALDEDHLSFRKSFS